MRAAVLGVLLLAQGAAFQALAEGPTPSSRCVRSAFNCSLASATGQRVVSVRTGSRFWRVSESVIRDGTGQVMGWNSRRQVEFNLRTSRTFDGGEYVLAISTSNGSAGWLPLSAVVEREDFLESRLPNWEYRPPATKSLGCFAVKAASLPDEVAEYKVVFDSKAKHEKVADFESRLRKNGRYSVNLVASVPGFGLGAPTIDHFPAGSLFTRLALADVPGSEIAARYWGPDATGRFVDPRGALTFYFGYFAPQVDGATVRRFGWVAADAREPAPCGPAAEAR